MRKETEAWGGGAAAPRHDEQRPVQKSLRMTTGYLRHIAVVAALSAMLAACDSEPRPPAGAFYKDSESSLRYPGPYDTPLNSEQVKALTTRTELQR